MSESASPEEPTVLVEVKNRVGWVFLNRPKSLNAGNAALRHELNVAMAELDDDPEVRIIVLSGKGKAFCAGNDLKEGATSHDGALIGQRRERLSGAVEGLSKPVLAAVHGAVYAGGCELFLACDLRIAATSAKICLSEVRIGSVPGGGGGQRLMAAIPQAVAAKILYSGLPIDGAEAYRVGLVSDLVEEDQLLAKAEEIANQIATNAPLSLLATKRSLSVAGGNPTAMVLDRTLWEFVAHTDDYSEARAAFREKREPNFKGR